MPRSPSRRSSRSPEPNRPSHRSHRSPSPSRRERDRDRDYDYRSPRERSDRRDDRDRDRRRYDDDRYDDRYVKDRRDDRERSYDRRDRDRDRERDRDRYNRSRDDRDDRRRDGSRERDRDRDRDRDRYRDGDRRRDDRDGERRRDDRDDDRRRERDSRSHDRERERERSRPLSVALSPERARASMSGSPAAVSEEEKQRLKRERLEAWKKQRLAKSATASKAATPEPGSPASPAKPKREFALSTLAHSTAAPGKSSLSFSATAFSGLSKAAPIKSMVSALDDDVVEDRKLEKLDLPDIDPEVQSGEAANVEQVTEDMAAEEADEDEKDVVMADANGTNGTNGTNGNGMDVDEEDEEDPLDAFMRENTKQVKSVNVSDAKRLDLMPHDDSDDETEVKNKAEEELAKAEALLQLAASKTRKKDLPTPDHATIEYEPFQKNFYRAPFEATEMTEEQVELMRMEMDGIKIRGADAPRPVKTWGAFGIPTKCLEIIHQKEWAAPTPIQAQAIPAIMSGRDVIGIAKTGSGKTIAFLLPMLRHVKDQRPVSGLDGPIALVLAPTRELAMQIYNESKVFAKIMGLRVTCAVGGQSISDDIGSMKKGAEIVVCTPGRMIDLLTANNGRVTNLRRVTMLIMDEADRMFDMGFEPQVMKMVNNTRPDAQKVLFSATFPKTMESLARKILIRPLEITVGGKSVVAPEIDQRVEVRDADTKFSRLLEILGEMGQMYPDQPDFRTLIFVERQEAADDLFRELVGRGYLAASLHGGRDQIDRLEAIKDFKSGAIPIVVATSVAARGLDVKELRLVINYDAPSHMEDYVHRAGRTGRAGNTGTCITFITPEQDKFSVDIVRALEASKAYIPDKLKEMAEGFMGKIKTGKAKAATSGFVGHGLDKLQRRREDKDRAEKQTYGDTSKAVSLSSIEGAIIPYKPKQTEHKPVEAANRGEADYTFTEIAVEVVHGPAPDKLPSGEAQRGTKAEAKTVLQQMRQRLDQARRENRTLDVASLEKIISKLQNDQVTHPKALALAGAVAHDPNRKTKDPDATDWHAIFPINDYPQNARWKVTSKEFNTSLCELTGASITMRGVYYPPGNAPAPGQEPKLHLLIESNEELRVRQAVDELRRTIVEASMTSLQNADRNPSASSRYAI